VVGEAALYWPCPKLVIPIVRETPHRVPFRSPERSFPVPAGRSKVSQKATLTGWSAFWNWQELGPVDGDDVDEPGGAALKVVLVRF
jgi:hypothetical protein